VPLAFVVFLLAGWVLYWVLVPRLQGSADPEMLSIILFFGLSQVIEAITTIFAGKRGSTSRSWISALRKCDLVAELVLVDVEVPRSWSAIAATAPAIAAPF
jgi:branched-subunit amino acid ABC-type transport system permease component